MASDRQGGVFLSFSAEDIGKNFGAHLYRSLLKANIQTITGDSAGTDTLTSVQQSRIVVVVFSKNYVSSGKALDELVKIRECTVTSGLAVIPVFYNVDKYTMENQLKASPGCFKLRRSRSVSRQRQALEEIAGMPGLNLRDFADRDEAACVRNFVETMLSELNIINSNIDRTFSSPSSMSSTLDWHDIFISFRGTDTRNSLVSHLYQSFAMAGICTFRDDGDLKTGEAIIEVLEGAIERTKIAVVVFSKHYTDSKWCMDELVYINKRRSTGLLLVPAFYGVDPSVVRYAKGLKHHNKRMPDMQTYRDALSEAADFSGFVIQCDNGNEAKFIQKITEAVAEKAQSLKPKLAEATDESASCFQLQTIQNGNEVETVQNIIEKVLSNFPSSSSLTPRWNVFLSFRGVDARKTFISHLYMEMKHANIQVFLDDDALRRGHKIKSGLFSAIRESKILIVVFSKNYASSKWCLDELVEILKCQNTQKLDNQKTTRQLFFPIFYDVDPRDVEKQEGSFRKAFKINNKRYPKEIVDIWRAALSEAGTMQGWDLHNSWDRREADLIQDVIAKVLCEITTI